MSQDFKIQTVSIPARSVTSAPRESKFPLAALVAAGEGSAFAIALRDENGNAYEGDELKKKASQRQSQMSQLAKTRGIKLTTRVIEKQEDNHFDGVSVPLLGVWYTGPATAKAAAVEAEAEVPEVPTI